MIQYEYECRACGKITLKEQPIENRNDGPICSHCGHTNTFKIITRMSFSLKGSGWSKDGYQKSGELSSLV